ncbi:acr-2, partial [Pristionchus pacificus]
GFFCSQPPHVSSLFARGIPLTHHVTQMTYRILPLLLLTVAWAQNDEGSGLLDSMEAAEPGNGTGSGEPEPGPDPANTTEPASSYDETITALLTDPTDLPSTTPIDIESLIDTSFEFDHEERLLIDLFREYNYLIRPVPSVYSKAIVVEFGVAMILLINVDERNQILQTNVWLTMKWNDYQLKWNPAEYGNVTHIHVPSDRVWLPDIVLFNNADGNYEVSFRSNALIMHNGDVTWVPPAMYLSSCRIDVEFFPFDEQTCDMIFGSWTYNSDEVRLSWYNDIKAVQLTDYQYSGIWDVIDVPGHLVHPAQTKESKIVFNVVIRRKTLFYTVILIIPTVLIAFLSMTTFYLPTDSGEKISLTINLLLALVVFLLLVSKILPPTSNIPLMGKYLLLAFVLNIITAIVTVIIVNIYFRSPVSHEMPDYVKKIFLDFLPRVLMMRRPERIPIFNGYFIEEYCVSEIFDASLVLPSMTATIVPFLGINVRPPPPPQPSTSNGENGNGDVSKDKNKRRWSTRLSKRLSFSVGGKNKKKQDGIEEEEESTLDATSKKSNVGESRDQRISRELKTTVEAVAYIAEHMKGQMSDKKARDDWKYVAMVIDRLLLLIFFGVTLGGTIGIICSAPHVFDFVDQEKVIKEINARYMNVTY